MQRACVILSSVACPALQHFPTLSHKRHEFRKKKVFEHKTCVSSFSTNFIWNIFHSKKNLTGYDTSVYWSSRKVPFSLVRFQWSFNLLDRFSKNIQTPNFMKIRLVGADFYHADGWTDGRTDLAKLIVFFSILRTRVKWTIKPRKEQWLRVLLGIKFYNK
jgi:hypothetical protein